MAWMVATVQAHCWACGLVRMPSSAIDLRVCGNQRALSTHIDEDRTLHQTGRVLPTELKEKLADTTRASWVGAPEHEFTCTVCGDRFHSRSRMGSRFCSSRCQQAAKRRERRLAGVGV